MWWMGWGGWGGGGWGVVKRRLLFNRARTVNTNGAVPLTCTVERKANCFTFLVPYCLRGALVPLFLLYFYWTATGQHNSIAFPSTFPTTFTPRAPPPPSFLLFRKPDFPLTFAIDWNNFKMRGKRKRKGRTGSTTFRFWLRTVPKRCGKAP